MEVDRKRAGRPAPESEVSEDGELASDRELEATRKREFQPDATPQRVNGNGVEASRAEVAQAMGEKRKARARGLVASGKTDEVNEGQRPGRLNGLGQKGQERG